MTPRDLRLLCTALGFTAVVIHGGKPPKQEAVRRAGEFAALIEEFCRLSVPEAVEGQEGENMRVVDLETTKPEAKFGPAERMATAIVEIYRQQGGCLPQDLIAKGFTPDEIDRHWALAKALATVGRINDQERNARCRKLTRNRKPGNWPPGRPPIR